MESETKIQRENCQIKPVIEITQAITLRYFYNYPRTISNGFSVAITLYIKYNIIKFSY